MKYKTNKKRFEYLFIAESVSLGNEEQLIV